jgi:cytochrome-b5 reductase
MDDHPGGPEIITNYGGEDATEEFEEVFHSQKARDMLPEYLIGSLKVSCSYFASSSSASRSFVVVAPLLSGL